MTSFTRDFTAAQGHRYPIPSHKEVSWEPRHGSKEIVMYALADPSSFHEPPCCPLYLIR